MNGRAFDPVIGRFLSADPYVDCLQNTQGWNRYSYVKGRLLSATDPTGYAADDRPDTRPTMPNEPFVSQVGGLDTVTQTASRIRAVFISLGGALGGSGVDGAETTGLRGGDVKPDRNQSDEDSLCNKDCMAAAQPFIQGVTGAAIGAATLGVPGALAGAAVGLTTGSMTRDHARANASMGAEAFGAAVTTYGQEVLSPGGTPGGAVSIAVSAAAAAAGSRAADWAGGTFGPGLAGLTSGTADALYASIRNLMGGGSASLLSNLRNRAVVPAIAAQLVHLAATKFAEDQCAQHCEK
jgi:hypothetical protein